ncbi:hypothetical protein AVEN_106486-1, partial [Araneus ventricosus]
IGVMRRNCWARALLECSYDEHQNGYDAAERGLVDEDIVE